MSIKPVRKYPPAFNYYILKAVDYLYAQYRLRGYGSAELTHDIKYGNYGKIQRTGGSRTMGPAAVMEVILTAMQIYDDDTNDHTVWDFLKKQSWEILRPEYIKAHIWVNPAVNSYGTADALRNFGMGINVPFRELLPGSFVNFGRLNGSRHAVVLLSHIDEAGVEYDTWNDSIVGFRYFSSQGGYEQGTGGLDYRYAIFTTDEYEQNGYPTMPYKRDIHVIYSTNQNDLNSGIMWCPYDWAAPKKSIYKKILRKIGWRQLVVPQRKNAAIHKD